MALAKTQKKGISSKKAHITFNPKQVTKRLLGVLSDRARDVLVKRYGLGEKAKRMTLEAIGKQYGVTRERVRQIENYALASIRKSDTYEKEQTAFRELHEEILFLGSIVSEEMFLEHVSKDEIVRNHIHFMLVLGHMFTKNKEDDDFTHRWHVDRDVAAKIETALRSLYENLGDDELVSEAHIIDTFLNHIKDIADHYRNEEMVRRWLGLSKRVGSNAFGEWGRTSSTNVIPKGIRDYAYLVIRRHGSPLHFSEVARRIAELFEKKAHVATTHNELIKDKRFVLVGRGLYALSEWGYKEGIVRDVIEKVLKQNGPLTKEEVIDRVLKERYVKPNTILVNLQNEKHFKKLVDNRYSTV